MNREQCTFVGCDNSASRLMIRKRECDHPAWDGALVLAVCHAHPDEAINPSPCHVCGARNRTVLSDLRYEEDPGLLAMAIEDLDERTLDGYPIRYRMTLTDYNLDPCQVTGIQSLSHGTVWYRTSTGMFDAGRLWAAMPPRRKS